MKIDKRTIAHINPINPNFKKNLQTIIFFHPCIKRSEMQATPIKRKINQDIQIQILT
jgi:hypothetical protein